MARQTAEGSEMTVRRLVYLLMVGVAAVLFLGAAPTIAKATPAPSDDTGLSYSTDGVSFSADPPPIFADEQKVTPGEEIRGVLWIRNSRPHTVDVSVLTSRANETSGIILGPAGSGTSTLGVGETTAVTVRAWLPPTAKNDTQDQVSENMRVIVHARDSSSSTEEPGQPEEHVHGKPDVPPGELEDTGYSGGLLPLALGILVTGGVLYAKSRCRTPDEPNQDGNFL
jgi:hypothetical protein